MTMPSWPIGISVISATPFWAQAAISLSLIRREAPTISGVAFADAFAEQFDAAAGAGRLDHRRFQHALLGQGNSATGWRKDRRWKSRRYAAGRGRSHIGHEHGAGLKRGPKKRAKGGTRHDRKRGPRWRTMMRISSLSSPG